MAQPAKILKIGLVLDTSLDPHDGVQQYVINIGEWLRRQRHDVHYIVGQTQSRDLPGLHSLAKNVGVRFNGNRTTIPLPTSRRKIRQFLQNHQFDVLHVQMPHSPFMSQRIILAADARTAIIGTFHILPYGWVASVASRGLGMWLRPSLKRFDTIVSVSPAAATFAHRSFGITTSVLPNVVDYAMFHAAKPFPAYKDGRLTILFLGRLVERKGCLTLLEAVAQIVVRENAPTFRVLICGRGHLETQLKQFVVSHQLEDIVGFTGFVSEADKPRYYASADIAVFPSKGGESFGIVLLEAMASGRAAVLTGDNPGYCSVMEPQPDLLFDPTDSTALAAKLVRYLTDKPLRRRQAVWGETYTESFDIHRVGAELLTIYGEALHKRRGL